MTQSEWSIRFTQSARKHRIGRAHASFVLATAKPVPTVSPQGRPAWSDLGTDDRGLLLEVIAASKGPSWW